MQRPNLNLILLGLLISLVLAGCSSNVEQADGPPEPIPVPSKPGQVGVPSEAEIEQIPDAVPRVERPNPANQRTYKVLGKTYYPLDSSEDFVQRGGASWYGRKFHGRRTANGERYNMYAMTAAHKRLPLPTYVRVRNLENDRSIVVRVNDRGPFHGNRIIDLSYTAARKLGMVKKGIAQVEVQAIDPRSPGSARPSPSVPKKVDKGTNIYIQAGAFAEPNNAHQLKLQLQQKIRHPVAIKTKPGTLRRVVIGPITSVSTAKKITQQLTNMDIHNPQVILR